MLRDQTVLYTKLNPPRLQRHLLARPRVEALLRDGLHYLLTIVQASTGYGKSTALAALADGRVPFFWYSVSEGDADPHQFLAHLIHAFKLKSPALPDTPLALLQEVGAASYDRLRIAADALLNALNGLLAAPSLLVLDDYHLAASPDVDALVEHFIEFSPQSLHVIVATRNSPNWVKLLEWRAHGLVWELKRDALAFTREEIAALFRETYGFALAPRDVELLEEKTEGWPIALQLVWQELRANPKTDVSSLLQRGSGSLDTLFAYLARNVLAKQSREVQDFLLQTALLRELEPAACDALSGRSDSRQLLAQLRNRDLFVLALGHEHYRFHHLFHDFLREQAARRDPAAALEQQRAAGEFYRGAGNTEEAIYHFLHAGAFAEATALIQESGDNILRAGRLDTLTGWIAAIPPAAVEAHPLLMFYLGDLARLRSRFDEALAWYAQSERAWRAARDVGGIARALRGQALVYLDTVRPAQAEDLLQEALRQTDRLDDRAARARLLELLAENKLNMGKAAEAEQLREQARTLREEGPSEDALSVRVKLRTGRLDEARRILETWARTERDQLHPPRAARETLLILSLIYSLQGQAQEAFDTAQEGIALGARLYSPFVSAVGQMRLGHAYQIRGELRAAMRCYEEAVALGDQLALPRIRVEAMWGLTRAHGMNGDLDAARRTAVEGIALGQHAGDAWVSGLLQIALGASQVVTRHDSGGIQVLGEALATFRACGDTFGRAAAHLWLALAHWHLYQRARALAHLDEALTLGQAQRYDYLFTTRTLLGWQDARVGVPLLLEARRHRAHTAQVTRLLAAMGLENVTAHPGYQLRIQTLGAFRVWRGENEVRAHEWQRRKARQLLQLFVTLRGRLLEREEIFEMLWEQGPPEALARDFKVALNPLYRVLEPDRPADMPSAFIAREGTAYGLRAGADVWIDADEFIELVARADKAAGAAALELSRRALALYRDDYLAVDARYESWASAERERLLALYLRAAERLAQELFERGLSDECLTWCERILARDRCWEQAYRLMMRAHAQRGDRAQAHRVFEQCVQVLRRELDVEPSPATVEVFRQVTGDA